MKEGNYLFINALNTIYGFTVKNYSLSEETCCHHFMGYSLWLTARALLCTPSHRQDSTYNSMFYISCGTLAEMRNSSMGVPWWIYLCPFLLCHRTLFIHEVLLLDMEVCFHPMRLCRKVKIICLNVLYNDAVDVGLSSICLH